MFFKKIMATTESSRFDFLEYMKKKNQETWQKSQKEKAATFAELIKKNKPE
jgi:hypothetical protein